MSNSMPGTVPILLSMSFTDKVVSRSLHSCVQNVSNVNPSTKPYFVRYATYAVELLDFRLTASEQSWFPLLGKYDKELSHRAEAHNHLRQTTKQALETLKRANESPAESFGQSVPGVLTKLWDEAGPVLADESALISKIGPRVTHEDAAKLEDDDKHRRLALMKKDGHLWCATYLMRALTPKEREIFPPGVPTMAKSAMLMAGNWQFSREFQFAPKV